MRFPDVVLCVLMTGLASGCGYWPDNLQPLADRITQEVSGEATAWRVGGNVVVINIANSPLFAADPKTQQTAATGIAAQAIAYSKTPLEGVSVTFHEGAVSEEADRMREFIFLIVENRPVLQPLLGEDATGPLTLAEVQALFVSPDRDLSPAREACVLREIEDRARAAGDPETLDPATVEFLPTGTWHQLDAVGKRLILAQVIATKAAFVCTRAAPRGTAGATPKGVPGH